MFGDFESNCLMKSISLKSVQKLPRNQSIYSQHYNEEGKHEDSKLPYLELSKVVSDHSQEIIPSE